MTVIVISLILLIILISRTNVHQLTTYDTRGVARSLRDSWASTWFTDLPSACAQQWRTGGLWERWTLRSTPVSKFTHVFAM